MNRPIKETAVSSLKLLENNPRTISPDEFEKLKASLNDFTKMLWYRPIVYDKDGNIIGGNMRFRAAVALGFKKVPAICADDLSEDEIKEFVIRDNIQSGRWDWQLITQQYEPEKLESWGLQMPIFELERQNTVDLERVEIDTLQPHPKNYKNHPDDQLEHIAQSIRIHGLIRNIIISLDNFIIAGHGVVQAIKKMGLTKVPVVRLTVNHDSTLAEKLLVADNEISHLSEIDDRKLSEMLRDIKNDGGLEGTGYTEEMLAALVMISRNANEIKDFQAAVEWVGMPEFIPAGEPVKLILQFDTIDERNAICEKLGIRTSDRRVFSSWFPERDKDDLINVKLKVEELVSE